MTSPIPPAAAAPRTVVFLPCHTLDDFPTWLDDREADDLLAVWTAAWHPRLVVMGGMPAWASIDLPPPEGPLVGLVPRWWDDRFAAQFDASRGDVRLVRGATGHTALTTAALAAIDASPGASEAAWVEDFHALGLAVLLAELLARRMRTQADFGNTGLPAAVAAAAAAAVEGRDDDVRSALGDCFRCLEASRARFYPVESWIVDLVVVSAATDPDVIRGEVAAPVPLGFVAAAGDVAPLADRAPEAFADLRRRIADGSVTISSGMLVERPLDGLLPEEVLESLQAGLRACDQATGCRPHVFARRTGGGSAILPQVLAGVGMTGAVWSTFDGAALPDPGAARIRWQGTGETAIDALARPPVDARSAAAVLTLPQRIGDALDHDHVAVTTLAHPAGTACQWHALVRRIGAWSTVLGTFVTPDELFRKTADAATPVTFGPDAFPPTPVPTATGDPLGAAVEAATAAARRIVAASAVLDGVVATRAVAAAEPRPAIMTPRGITRAVAGWWGGGRRDDPDLVLASGEVSVAVHPETGGVLALRRPGPGPNRLSQQLAIRRPAGYGRMVAESIARGPTASGTPGIVSRGRLLDDAGREAGRFVQGVSLVPGHPIAVLDVEVDLGGDGRGGLADHHLACRFAWHENEDVDLRRSIHGQAVTTERTRFTAPHFVELVPAGVRGSAAEPVTILCGGLPWHERSTPHVLDTILAWPVGTATRRLAVGIGVERPWDAALELLAGNPPGSGPRPGPANVRVTVLAAESRDGRLTRARLGLVESAGHPGDVRLEWGREVASAAACEFDGRPRPTVAVATEGRGVVVFLRAHEWLAVDLEFGA